MNFQRRLQQVVPFLVLFIFLLGCRVFSLQAAKTGASSTPTLQISSTQSVSHESGEEITCPQPQEIQTGYQINKILASLEWTPAGEYSSRPLGITADIRFPKPVTLNPGDIQPPQRCLDRPDCRHTVVLDMSRWVEGANCLEEEPVLWLNSCKVVEFEQDTVLRFRVKLLDTHPGEWNYIPTIELVPSCSTPCQSNQFRCALDNTCWDSFDQFCRICLGKEKEQCACQSPQGDLPDGSDCQYWISGDVLEAGKCASGWCR